MKLTGYTNSNERSLNWAILNVARKLKINLWDNGYIKTKAMDDTSVNDRVDVLIKLANKLYK
jgi:hypothetical protein